MDFSDINNLITSDLEEVENVLEDHIQSTVPLVYEISKYLLGSGGKRLRPSILLLSCGACGLKNGTNRIHAAAALELVHTATLLHDDVVDEAEVRRGNPSSNVVWGNKPTVLVGDFMLAQALSLIHSCGNLKLIKALTDASSELAEGQVLEVMSGKNMADISEEICFSIIERKTAALIKSCGKIGALLAESNNGNINALEQYGLNIGIAFQLVDDALDYSSTEQEFGKQVGQDLLEQKMTLPLFYALEKTPRKLRNDIVDLLEKDDIDDSEIDKIREIVNNFEGVEATKLVAKDFITKAKEALQAIPTNGYKNSLSLLADFIVERTK